MKLLNSKHIVIALVFLFSTQALFTLCLSAKNTDKIASSLRKHKKAKKVQQQPAAAGNTTNTTVKRLSSSIYHDLNHTYVTKPINIFKTRNRNWDYKMLDRQLEDIYRDMLYTNERNIRPLGIRPFIQTFIQRFENCDTNADNVLSFAEFTGCMSNDTFFKRLTRPNAQPYPISTYVPNQNYTSNVTYWYQQIFTLLDENLNNYLNFHDYMKLRLMVFSWKHCSVQGPFIEETNFECAIEVSSGSRSLSKTTARRLFQLALDISNLEYLRNLDFVSYLQVALPMRLYGKINGKEDGDITRSEFNTALDNNVLPVRYSQMIIDQFFSLTNQNTKYVNSGIDKVTFFFLDFNLRLFTIANATRPYYITRNEFLSILSDIHFPNKTLAQIYHIPAYAMTNNSFQMFASMNISQFYTEDDYLLKSFLEVNSKKATKGMKLNSALMEKLEKVFSTQDKAAGNASAGNITFNITQTANTIFNLLDVNNDNFVTFEDFAHMMELIYIFNKADTYCKGRLSAGTILEIFKSYSDYPRISYINRLRVRRLDLLNQDLLLNVFELLVIMKVDDMIGFYLRKTDKSTVYEVDLKVVLAKCGMRYIPEAYLNKCLRGNDINNVPIYDWECSISNGITLMSQFYEAAYQYRMAKKHNLNIVNTVFVNVDPQIG